MNDLGGLTDSNHLMLLILLLEFCQIRWNELKFHLGNDLASRHACLRLSSKPEILLNI